MGGVYLGAGRNKADDDVYGDVGFEILRKPGTAVAAGDSILRVWGHTQEAVDQAVATVTEGVVIEDVPESTPSDDMILEEITSL
jgi:pyrimidine-nucleoside phosphorylase/thymidine phosphorylase